MALLGGQWDPVKVDSGRQAGTVAAEDEPGHSDAVPRKVDPEDVRVIGVVGMKPKAFEQRGYGTEGPNRDLAAPDEDLDAGTDHGPRHHVRPLGAPPVPATKVCPDLGVCGTSVRMASWGTPIKSRSNRSASPLSQEPAFRDPL